jgi:hypothetical protein
LKKPSTLSIIHEGYETPPSFVPPTTPSIKQLDALLFFETRLATIAATTGASRPRMKASADEATVTSEYTPRHLKCYLRVALTILGSLFVCVSLLARANGALSYAVELAHVKYRTNVAYTKYVDNVPLFVPYLSKLFPHVHLEILPKGKDWKKSWRIFSERSHKSTASIGKDKSCSSDWLSFISTSDWLSFMDPRETMVRWTKAKQFPTRVSKSKVASVADCWNISRLFSGSKSKDDCKIGRVMWRLDPDKIFL